METRNLGRSGLAVSRIGLGLAAIGRPGYINAGRDRDLGPDRSVEAFRRRAYDLLDAALAGGVAYFDAARSYGLAEEFLGGWLESRAIAPGRVTVGSKWGYRYTADWRVGAEVNEIKDHSAANLRRQIAESRAPLGERLGLYQIHSATLESGVLEDGEVLDELRRLADGGLVVGLSVSGPRQADTIRRALEVRAGGRPLFASVQATWNLLEPSAGPALAEARTAGLGVIVKEVVANGRLASRPGQPGPRAVEAVAERLGSTADAVAFAAALAQPWCDVALSGAVTTEQLAANLAALGTRPTADDFAELAAIREPADRYWALRAALPWT